MQVGRRLCSCALAPLSLVAAVHAAGAGLPAPEELLGHGPVPCTQRLSCSFFDDILVVVHFNPIRLEWVDPVLDFVGAFALHPNATRQGRAALDYLYVGRRGTRVHLVDSREGQCDHHDVAVAMRLYPAFTGYLSLSHEDLLLSFWNLAEPGRLAKGAVWRQRPDRVDKRRIRGSGETPQVAAIRRAMSRFSVSDAHRAGNPALTMAPCSGVYYVPRSVAAKFTEYSSYLWAVSSYQEIATPILLGAVTEAPYLSLHGRLDWGRRRQRYRRHFVMGLDFMHPVRCNSELWARLTAAAARGEQLNRTPPHDLWTRCFRCDEYPEALWASKGRLHSCSEGCGEAPPPALGTLGPDVGVVSVRRRAVLPPGEDAHEGFWTPDARARMFARFSLLNATGLAARPLASTAGSKGHG
eukprot:TRINITY_DN34134_c0_g1_i2.p1 TRINITY_DN34134_c0_g1~~TRINITY_DN34134_c0_g1_i2.p1  ORF type:complete len:411 (+),score=31.90 TRINITY_DN34134_c0_g1_i2:102-1334(+)